MIKYLAIQEMTKSGEAKEMIKYAVDPEMMK